MVVDRQRLMSPRSALTSCGSSSILKRQAQAPIFVQAERRFGGWHPRADANVHRADLVKQDDFFLMPANAELVGKLPDLAFRAAP